MRQECGGGRIIYSAVQFCGLFKTTDAARVLLASLWAFPANRRKERGRTSATCLRSRPAATQLLCRWLPLIDFVLGRDGLPPIARGRVLATTCDRSYCATKLSTTNSAVPPLTFTPCPKKHPPPSVNPTSSKSAMAPWNPASAAELLLPNSP